MIEEIIKIEYLGETDELIDITTDGNHLFFANDILTHNSGFSNSDPDMDDISDSFAVNFVADVVLALISNDELKENDQLMIKQLKNRLGDVGNMSKFLIGFERAKALFYDLDSPSKGVITGSLTQQDTSKLNF